MFLVTQPCSPPNLLRSLHPDVKEKTTSLLGHPIISGKMNVSHTSTTIGATPPKPDSSTRTSTQMILKPCEVSVEAFRFDPSGGFYAASFVLCKDLTPCPHYLTSGVFTHFDEPPVSCEANDEERLGRCEPEHQEGCGLTPEVVRRDVCGRWRCGGVMWWNSAQIPFSSQHTFRSPELICH